ncbi:MAG: ABC transporter ATP-binding protein, partial [Bacteroidales bacterium]
MALIFGLVEKVTVLPSFAWNTDTLVKIAYYHIGQIQIEYGPMEALLFVAGLFVISSFFSNLFRFMGVYFLTPIRVGVIQDLRNDLYTHILALPMAYFSEQRKGDLIARATSDMNEVEWAIAQSLQSLIKDPLNVIIFLLALIAISPSLVLFVVMVLPITAFIVARIGKTLKRNADKTQSQMGGLLSAIEESISGVRVIKSFNLIGLTFTRFKKSNALYTAILNKTQQRRDLADPLTEFLSIGALILVLWFGGNLVLVGNLRADVLILFVVVFARLISPAKATANAYYNVQKGRAALQRIYEVIDEPQRIQEKEQALEKKSFTSQIVYNNVCFKYSGTHEEVLKNLNLTIHMGETLAIVGNSGSGKTTMVDLLPRFYDCGKGSIQIDGVDIRDLKLRDLRDLIGVVTQNPFLWNDTIANNIRFGRVDVSMAQVKEAAKKAFADDFIMEMPNGYDTLVGDLGIKLSGGQRQRIVIAR